jgi:multidrug efflux pump subunit AcrA (membrane-fusion protein)
MQEKLFRKSALERMTSPERLDTLMQVTPFRAWLALLAVAGLIAALVFWGFTGSIPVTVQGEGILLRGGSIDTLATSVSGQVLDIYIEAGDVVAEGDVVARISRAEEEVITPLTSPLDGRILEVRVSEGSFVQVGTTLASLEPVDAPLEAILYVSPTEGKNIEPGMSVQLSPSTVQPEEHGFLLGTVTSIGKFPATTQGMLRVLGSEDLVRRLSTGGNPIEVHVRLRENDANPSGYEWSSPQGPGIEMQSGTITTGKILLKEIRPISMVFVSQP